MNPSAQEATSCWVSFVPVDDCAGGGGVGATDCAADGKARNAPLDAMAINEAKCIRSTQENNRQNVALHSARVNVGRILLRAVVYRKGKFSLQDMISVRIAYLRRLFSTLGCFRVTGLGLAIAAGSSGDGNRCVFNKLISSPARLGSSLEQTASTKALSQSFAT